MKSTYDFDPIQATQNLKLITHNCFVSPCAMLHAVFFSIASDVYLCTVRNYVPYFFTEDGKLIAGKSLLDG